MSRPVTTAGPVIENPLSGERIVIRETGAETGSRLLTWELSLAAGGRPWRGGDRPARHGASLRQCGSRHRPPGGGDSASARHGGDAEDRGRARPGAARGGPKVRVRLDLVGRRRAVGAVVVLPLPARHAAVHAVRR